MTLKSFIIKVSLAAVLGIALITTGIIIAINKNKPIEIDAKYQEKLACNITTLFNYNDYVQNMGDIDTANNNYDITEDSFRDYRYILVSYDYDSCSEKVNKITYDVKKDTLNIYYDMIDSPEVCSTDTRTDIVRIKTSDYKAKIKVYYTYSN